MWARAHGAGAFLAAFALALLVVVGETGRAPRLPHRPRGVILISIDTLRPDHLGCYGYASPTSPALDEFRKDAILFRQTIAQAPSTLPSHASLLTSLNPSRHGASLSRGRTLASRRPTLAEVVRAAGFATASFNGGYQLDAVFGLGRGFETYLTPEPSLGPSLDLDRFEDIVGAGLRWLGAPRRGRFFLFLHTYEVHHPYAPAAWCRRLFGGTYRGSLPDRIDLGLLEAINSHRIPLGPGDLEHIVASYDAEIRSTDAAFARLRQGLDKLGLYEETLIIVTSDHGEEFGEHGSVGWHGHTLYDELLRVPLLVKLPFSHHGGESFAGLSRLIDVAPTVLGALGLPPPRSFQGVDLVPVLEHRALGPLLAVSALDDRSAVAVRGPRWKWYNGALFDLTHDSHERSNVAAAHPDEVAPLATIALSERRAAAVTTKAAEPSAELVERLHAIGYLAE
jgi:Sulfatase